MNIALRRRLAVGAVATATAVVAGLAVAPAALAGNITSVSPSFDFNNDDSEILTFTTQSSFSPDPAGAGAVTVTMTRTGTTTDSFDNSASTAYTDPNHPKAEFNFKDTGDGANDGPANPGSYDVKITDNVSNTTDSCQACFQVLTFGTLGISSAAPSSVAAGGSADVTFTGSGFARGTKVELLMPGTSTVDPNVTVGAPTMTGTPQQCLQLQKAPGCTVENPNRTTNSTLLRKISITTADLSGPRDVRVTNIDGTTATCSGCFTVNGAPLTAVSPSVADNSPSATPTVRITFSGTNVPQGAVPTLAFVGNAGSSTKDALTLKGTNATYSQNSVSADFDVRSAAPGVDAYVPTLTAADGSTNTCSCHFSIAQASPPTVTSLSPNTMAQSDSRTVTVTGSNFSRGVKIAFSTTGVDVTSVQFVSPTQVKASVQVQGNAATGKRDVTASTTSGPTGDPSYPKTGPACAGCFTVTASGSPTPTPTSSGGSQGCPSKAVTVKVNTPTINATGNASVTVSGATPTATIELQGYSQNHYGTASFANDPTPVDRTGQADSNGMITFNDLKPASNTRVRARQAGCAYGNSAVITVRAQETLAVKRIGTRKYTFSGRSIPARPGGLIVSLYRIVGSACAAGVEPSSCPGEKFIGQARAQALGAPNQGLYSITITFPSSDQNFRDEFVVKTGADAQNAPGRSNARSLLIY